MVRLVEEIERCRGIDGCYAKSSSIPTPIEFNMDPKSMRIMVVTEQPKGIRKGKSDLKEAFDLKPKSSLPMRLEELLGHEFSQNVKNENGLFYWTHFIKCPGEFREEKGVVANACADTWLSWEILALKALLIIGIGSMVNRWLFEQVPGRYGLLSVTENDLAEYKKDWREYLWKCEICSSEVGLGLHRLRLDDNAVANLVCLFHPSERSGIGWFIDKKLKLLVKRSVEQVKALMK